MKITRKIARMHGTKAKQRKIWLSISNWFRWYQEKLSPSARCIFRYREGWWLLLRFILLSAGFIFAGNKLTFYNCVIAIIALALLVDTLAANISMAFVTMDPINNLRSFLLTFFAFTHIILFYAIFYRFFEREFSGGMCAVQALYFSVVTITTVGYGDFVPKPDGVAAQITVMFELLTGLFFVTGVFARIIGFKEK